MPSSADRRASNRAYPASHASQVAYLLSPSGASHSTTSLPSVAEDNFIDETVLHVADQRAYNLRRIITHTGSHLEERLL